ncbi:MAG TPA: CDP-alcohol phosphatidyltransferase family protein [Ktedonobacterales bacterium]|nr:CDP-alcohol phosphatidyltransferase family protein [Ktedonobacterales bacterium]
MFGPRIQQYARRMMELMVWPLAAIGLTPNMATLIGLLLNCGAAALIASGSLRVGGVALLIAGAFDMVDGALARVRSQQTTFGAFFDSTIDRYAEGVILLGVIIYALRAPSSTTHAWVVTLAYIAALGSLMVSYTRARAEGLGLSLKTGLMARPERVVLLAAGLIIGAAAWLPWTLLLLALTSVFTSTQRIFDVYRMLSRQAASAPASASAMESQTTTQQNAPQPRTRPRMSTTEHTERAHDDEQISPTNHFNHLEHLEHSNRPGAPAATPGERL